MLLAEQNLHLVISPQRDSAAISHVFNCPTGISISKIISSEDTIVK